MSRRTISIICLSVGLILGLTIGAVLWLSAPRIVTVTRTVTVTATPSSCVAALDQDNAWFQLIEQSLGDYQWGRVADGINATVQERTSNYADCRAHLNQKGVMKL
jgi:hypothetical protein